MESIWQLIDFVLHVDKHLRDIFATYGTATYAILFAIIFCETGLVVTPFLPGDSLLFAAGAIVPQSWSEAITLSAVLIVAAVIGDSVNYRIGKMVGPRVFTDDAPKWVRKDYLLRTQKFFAKHGGKTIVIARFVPIIRTFAPFLAGVGSMSYSYFITYNIVGGVAWVLAFVLGGYAFGELPVVKQNFGLVIIGIIFVSLLPPVVEYLRARREGAVSQETA